MATKPNVIPLTPSLDGYATYYHEAVAGYPNHIRIFGPCRAVAMCAVPDSTPKSDFPSTAETWFLVWPTEHGCEEWIPSTSFVPTPEAALTESGALLAQLWTVNSFHPTEVRRWKRDDINTPFVEASVLEQLP